MRGTQLPTRLRSVSLDRNLALAAAIALGLATTAVAYGLVHDDVVTIVSALPFVPAALLLVAIGLSVDPPTERDSGSGGAV